MREIGGETPKLSVVMPVHNALPYLDAAVESILGQSEPRFEFVILDDASSDGSRNRLHEWAKRDPRIRLIEAERNLGPALSSQRVALAARAPLVARMDADDIAHPDRLRDQLEVLQSHREAGLVACLCDFIDSKGAAPRQCERWRLTRRSVLAPFAHGTIMYRRELFERVGGYRQECVFWEDQDLVARLSREGKVLVIPRVLYRYRLSGSSTRIASNPDQLEHSVDLMYRSVERLKKQQGYDDLLTGFIADGSKVNPRVFVSLGSQILWAGGRPRLFRRALARGDLRLDLTTIAAVTWAAWASASPATLRSFLRVLVWIRNFLTRNALSPNEPVRWNSGPPVKEHPRQDRPRGSGPWLPGEMTASGRRHPISLPSRAIAEPTDAAA